MRAIVIILLVLTFPIWIGIAAGLFGVIVGLIGGAFGLVFGLIGAIFGAIGALIGGIFDLIFHPWGGHWDNDGWDGPRFNAFWFAVGLIAVVLLVRKRQTR